MLTGIGCCLCSQIEGDEQNDLIARLLPHQPYVRRVLLENESFAVIPSLGPLADGHVLLCPKAHVRSFAQLSARMYGGYAQAKARLGRVLRSAYGNAVHIFEHGMSSDGHHVLCTTDHAHMHFVPLPERLAATWLDMDGWTEFDGSLAALTQIADGHEYLLYEGPDRRCHVYAAGGGGFESQHMRRAFSHGLNNGADWDWRRMPNPEAADAAWRRCSQVTHHLGRSDALQPR